MKKSLGIAVRAGVWVATATVMLACMLFARLLFAPIDLGFAKEQLIDQAEGILPGWQISFDQTEIGWDWRRVRPWVSIQNLRLVDRADRLTATIPQAQVGVTFASLLGDVGLSTIELDAANVIVSDLAGFSDATGSGMFSELFGTGGIPKPAVFRPVTEGFSRFGERLMARAPGLKNILLTSSIVEIMRGENYDSARFAVPRLELRKREDRLQLEALADISMGGSPVQLRLQGEAEPDVGEMMLAVAFSQMRPRDLRFQAELPEVITYLDFPVTLNLELELASNIGLRGAKFNLSIDEGFVNHPVRFPTPGAIEFGNIDGFYDAAEEMLVFEAIELETPTRTISGDGALQWLEGQDKPAAQFTLITDAASIAEVKQYWPIATYPDGTPRGARVWVDQNMIDGLARDVRFEVDWSPIKGGAFEYGSAFKLTFDFQDIDTRYLRDMPPIVGASGYASLTRQVFDVAIERGTVMKMPIDGSKAHMYNIHHPGEGIGEFDIQLEGDVPSIMKLISYEPLNVPQKMNFDPDRLGGDASIQVAIELPLIKSMPKEAVKYDVQASIAGTKVADLLGGEGIRDGAVKLWLDSDNLSLEGTARLNGVPLKLFWREDFQAGRDNAEADTTEMVLSGSFDENDLKALGVDVSDFLKGRAQGEAIFLGRSLRFRTGQFSADASSAILKVPQLAWEKASASPAMVTGTVEFADNETRLAPLVVKGEGIDVHANFSWRSKESGVFFGNFSINSLGRHQLTGTVDQRSGSPTTVKIKAAQFDAGAYLAGLSEPTPEAVKSQEEQQSEGADLNLVLSADRMVMLNGEYFDNVSFETQFRQREPTSLTLEALVGGTNKPVLMSISENDDPKGQALAIQSEDAGQFLRGLGLFSHVRDGTLKMDGFTSGWGNDLTIEGEAKIKDSLLVSQANLGPSVEEGVVSGLDEFVSKGPVELDNIEIPFDYRLGILDLSGLKANGPTLGMTMEGQISAREGKINVNGVFVPAYGLNALLGKIPIVGSLLTGGKGKGVFGVSYRVKGPLDNPDFSINPVSGLAPGFLRLLFEGRKGKIADVKIPDEKPVPDAEAGQQTADPALDTAQEAQEQEPPQKEDPQY